MFANNKLGHDVLRSLGNTSENDSIRNVEVTSIGRDIRARQATTEAISPSDPPNEELPSCLFVVHVSRAVEGDKKSFGKLSKAYAFL